jgi:general secretion pathway protein L
MRNTLLLRPDPAADGWRWLQLDDNGRPQGGTGSGSLQDAAAAANGLRAVVLAPGIECLLATVRIPGHSRKKLLQAVPYALEEQVSDEVENLHFAVAAVAEDGAWPVAVISRRYMETLQQQVAEAGLDVQQVIPELLAVPYQDNATSVLLDNELALVRTGPAAGYAVDTENLGLLLTLREDTDADQPLPALRVFAMPGTVLPEQIEYDGEVTLEPYAGDPLEVLAQGLDASPINLLQGRFSRAAEWGQALRPWRATAALLLAGIVVSNVAMGIDYYRLSRESAQLRAQIEETFKTALPEVRRIVNPRVQMQQQLDKLQRGSGGGADFLTLLAQSAAVLKGRQGVDVTAATFRAGRLDVDLTVSDLQLLDQLKQALMQNSSLEVEIQSATTGTDQRVQGRLRIQGAGA